MMTGLLYDNFDMALRSSAFIFIYAVVLMAAFTFCPFFSWLSLTFKNLYSGHSYSEKNMLKFDLKVKVFI
jgi:hypothetical protein